MANTWTCHVCGGTTKEYDPTQRCVVCLGCGTPVSEVEQNERAGYERSKALARDHLRVGNWYEAKRLIEPLCSSRPADKELYLMLLCSVTKNLSDFLYEICDDSLREEAAKYWDKLEKLRCVTHLMKEYARKRNDYVRQTMEMYKCKRGLLILISILMSFITICMLLADSDIGLGMIGISAICWVILYMWFVKNRRVNIIYYQYSDRNPFKYE